MDEATLDDIIRRLVAAKNGRTTKQVQLTEAEIRQLCAASREVFLSQPNLLELEAPIKICGNLCSLEIVIGIYVYEINENYKSFGYFKLFYMFMGYLYVS